MGKRILVVEDDPDIREYLCLVLEDLGAELATAADGREALAMIDAGPQPDLILLDVIMPTMGGEEFLRELREVRRLALPVLVTSVDEVMADRLRSVGEVQGTFLKGTGAGELRAKVRSLLG